ncbi:hypothetical protein ACHAXS_009356 [Conticribra weissflogii]
MSSAISRGQSRKKRSRKDYLEANDEYDVENTSIVCSTQSSPTHGEQRNQKRHEQGEDPSVDIRLHAQLPSYLSEAFADLYSQDGLIVFGRGLGWLGLLAAFVRFYGDVEDGYSAALNPDDGENDDLLRDKVEPVENMNGDSEGKRPHHKSDATNIIGAGGNRDDHATKINAAQPPRPQPQKTKRKPPLVFVLNLRDHERQTLFSTLTSWGTPPSQLPTLIISESGQAKERAALYARGGVFVITSRILIVDLLTGVAKARDVEGMLVAHAEKCVEKSTEAFILRIFRSQKYFMRVGGMSSGGMDISMGRPNDANVGFVKAFTDDPSSLMAGFAKVDKILKSLQVPSLYLYPRFHAAVAEELEKYPPIVEELHQTLSPKMQEIQLSLAAAVRACVRELRKASSLVDISFLFGGERAKKKRRRDDGDFPTGERKGAGEDGGKQDWEITIEHCVSTNFDMLLMRQLEGDWHRLKPNTKQYITDLRYLRNCFHALIQYDCVQFWRFLEGIKAISASSRTPSMWLMTPPGENVYRLAKERVYRVINGRKRNDHENGYDSGRRLMPVLEETPKEKLLQQVLTEIENRWYAKRKRRDENNTRSCDSGNVLLMVKDEATLESIRSFLANGGKRTMILRWLRYLEQVNEKSRSILRSLGKGPDAIPEEQRLLMEEEGRIRNHLFGVDSAQGYEQEAIEEERKRLADWKRKHRRVVDEKARGTETATADALRHQGCLEEAMEASKRGNAMALAMDSIFQHANDGKDGDDLSSTHSWSSDEEDEIAYKVEPIKGMSLFIRTFSKLEDGDAALLLRDIQPDTVIMYDSDPSFIRTLEIYANAMQPVVDCRTSSVTPDEDNRLKVFFLLYEASAEETNFLKSLEREQNAFERLIDHKKRMPHSLPSFNNFSTQEMQHAYGGFGGSYAGGTLPLSMDTRTGRGKQSTAKERRDIAVDVREFRSALPSILHQGGMRLAPVTLVVGDFVLSNVHCVERKSISDLFGSFASGRLYTQAEAMSKYYKVPCLLIEFDPDKTFALQNASDIGNEIRTDSVCSKMTLLVMHFPKLRILWSRSPHETLKIFKKLKRNHEEVDVDKAVEIGTNDTLDELLLVGTDGYVDDEDNGEVNDAAKHMLMRLPGVNVHNARKIMSECESIQQLSELTREELKRIAGPVAGQKLFTFFRQPFTA